MSGYRAFSTLRCTGCDHFSCSCRNQSAPFVMQPKEVVSVGVHWAEWSRCLTAKYQRDQLYRLGKFDDCGRQWNDFKTSIQAKFTKDEAEAKSMLKSTYYHEWTTVSPTVGVIWELKDPPSW